MGSATLDDIASVLNYGGGESQKKFSFFGMVDSIESDGTINVISGCEVDDSTTPPTVTNTLTACMPFVQAEVGDVVFVHVFGGKAVALEKYGGSGGGGTSDPTTYYGTCTTTAGTAEKAVTCDGFRLVKGAIVGILFTVGNTAATPTLNINGTGALTLYVANTPINSTTNTLKWSANTMLYVMYDGATYRFITASTQASAASVIGSGAWYGNSSTAAATAAKTTSITNFRLSYGAHVSVMFVNGSSSDTMTLDVSSTGEKTVYINGAAVSADNPLYVNANSVITFAYNGSGWVYVSGADMATERAVLYSNEAGSNGNITLSDSAANYKYMRIYTFNTDGVQGYQSYDVYNPNGKYVFLANVYTSAAHAWTQGRCVYINGTSITTYNNYYGVAQVDGSSTFNSSNFIYIYRVEAWNDDASFLDVPLSADKINGATCWYGTCATSASTRGKAVTCAGFELKVGARVTVRHSTANTVKTTSTAGITLNMNGTGGKAIAMYDGTTLRTTAANSGYTFFWHAGDVITYVYDGTYWLVADVQKSINHPMYSKYTKTSGSVASSATSVTVTQTLDYGYELWTAVCPRTNGWVGSPYVGTYSFTASSRSASATVWWTHTGSGTVSVDFLGKWVGMMAN